MVSSIGEFSFIGTAASAPFDLWKVDKFIFQPFVDRVAVYEEKIVQLSAAWSMELDVVFCVLKKEGFRIYIFHSDLTGMKILCDPAVVGEVGDKAQLFQSSLLIFQVALSNIH